MHGHGWLKVCTSENWTDPELWRRGISVITVYVLVSQVARIRFPRIFQHTSGTYPRPSTNSLWRNSFSFGGLGMPGASGVCSLKQMSLMTALGMDLFGWGPGYKILLPTFMEDGFDRIRDIYQWYRESVDECSMPFLSPFWGASIILGLVFLGTCIPLCNS